MKVLILIPDGVGIKNYLYSDFVESLLENKDIHLTVLSTLPKAEIRELIETEGYSFELYEWNGYREGLEKVLREAIRHAKLSFFSRKMNNPTFMNYSSRPAGKKGRFLLSISKFIGSFYLVGGYNYIKLLNKLYAWVLANKSFTQVSTMLEKLSPDVILSTHQRPVENIPIYEVARRLKIVRTSVIYSWDNVPKAALYTPSDKYFLWSTLMKRQMTTFYPEIPAEKLFITGTPQFSFYRNKNFQWEKDSFYRQFKIPIGKEIILFSGSDLVTSPYDPELLEDVAKAVLNIEDFKRPILIFRRSPAGFSNRYDDVLAKYSFIISIDPLWINRGTTWRTAIPTRQDIRNLVGLVQYCSLIINVGSTMALDGAVFNKPCIYIAYSPDSAPHFNYGEVIHTEEHFKVMKDMDAVLYVNYKKDLQSAIQVLLTEPEKYCTGKAKYLNTVTDNIISEAGNNIISELRMVGGN